MRKITYCELMKKVGERILVIREGIVGNHRWIDGRLKEGELSGLLQFQDDGFFVKMFKTEWRDTPDSSGRVGNVFDFSSFIPEQYMLRNFDVVHFLTPKGRFFGRGYSVKLY